MRKSNWKIKVLIFAGFILGVIAAIAVAVILPEQYDIYRGLLAFGALAAVSSAVVFIGIKVFRIGEN